MFLVVRVGPPGPVAPGTLTVRRLTEGADANTFVAQRAGFVWLSGRVEVTGGTGQWKGLEIRVSSDNGTNWGRAFILGDRIGAAGTHNIWGGVVIVVGTNDRIQLRNSAGTVLTPAADGLVFYPPRWVAF